MGTGAMLWFIHHISAYTNCAAPAEAGRVLEKVHGLLHTQVRRKPQHGFAVRCAVFAGADPEHREDNVCCLQSGRSALHYVGQKEEQRQFAFLQNKQ